MNEQLDPREDAAEDARHWIDTADEGLVHLMRLMTHHDRVNWNAPDYITADEFGTDMDTQQPIGDGRRVVTDGLEYAEALGSKVTGPLSAVDDMHVVAIDVDVPAWLVPSSTDGHGHLYVHLPCPVPTEDLFEFLDAAAVIGLVEPGYVSACRSRGMTSVRAPWIRKGEEPSTVLRARQVEPGGDF
jgi:hypothetical protein